jgi:DUF2934 family protein
MNIRAQKSGRRARKRAVIGDGVIARLERDKDVRQLVAAEAKDRTADHQARIALTAYFIAEKRGFEPGHELDDWLAAEAAVARAEQQLRVTKPIEVIQAKSLS